MRRARPAAVIAPAIAVAVAVTIPLTAAWSEAPAGLRSVLIGDVPHVRQKPDFCGEACVAMALAKLGHAADQDDVFDRTGLDPLAGRGAYTADLVRAVERIGFRPGPVWFYVSPERADAELAAQLGALHADLLRGIPSIVCMHYDESPRATEHFRLVLGYDRATDEIVYHEPAEQNGAYRRMSRARLLKLWPLKYRRDQWTVIRIALEPGRIDLQPRARGVTPAAHAQHLMKLRPRIPEGFHTAIVGPFLLLGDETPERLRRHVRTVTWTLSLLKSDFAMVEPREITDVWLLGTDDSYAETVMRLFNERPSTPYGFFLPEKRTLIMNIATGGGTLVHEVVHPLLRASFPGCPGWFNEGLASLYERVQEKDGHLWGLPNWRLPDLQRAIRAGRLPSFAAMTAQTDKQFYASHTGYAQARYLCLYLQEKELLRRFYARYRANHAADPTGYRTLTEVLGEKDMTRFQSRWEEWVLTLEPG